MTVVFTAAVISVTVAFVTAVVFITTFLVTVIPTRPITGIAVMLRALPLPIELVRIVKDADALSTVALSGLLSRAGAAAPRHAIVSIFIFPHFSILSKNPFSEKGNCPSSNVHTICNKNMKCILYQYIV